MCFETMIWIGNNLNMCLGVHLKIQNHWSFCNRRCWVPFKALVPCHFFWPFLVHLLVVLTLVTRSWGNSGPKSNSPTNPEVDQIHVRFHVLAKCLRIQNATRYTLMQKKLEQEELSKHFHIQLNNVQHFKDVGMSQNLGPQNTFFLTKRRGFGAPK